MILTDESVITIFQSEPRFGTRASLNHAMQTTPEERDYLLKHAITHLNLPVDQTEYRVTNNKTHTFSINTIYTNIRFIYHNHESRPDLVVYTTSGFKIIKLCISYKPINVNILKLGLTSFLISKTGYNMPLAHLYCINNAFRIDSSNHSFFSIYNMTKRTQKTTLKITNYLNSPPSTSSLPAVSQDTREIADIFYLINMPYKNKLFYFNEGIRSFELIYNSITTLSDNQRKQCLAEINQEPFLDLTYLKSFFAKLTPTILFFDIEACQFPYPTIFTKQPFETFPFLFSIHQLNTTTDHHNHASQFFFPDNDFRRNFAESLIKQLNTDESIIIFDATMERKLLLEFCTLFPDLSHQLTHILDRFVDLSSLFLNHHVIFPGMQGKYSVKQVMQSINKTNPYDKLSIQSGFFASHHYKQLIYDKKTDKNAIKKAISDYCKADTFAMVIIYRYLYGLIY